MAIARKQVRGFGVAGRVCCGVRDDIPSEEVIAQGWPSRRCEDVNGKMQSAQSVIVDPEIFQVGGGAERKDVHLPRRWVRAIMNLKLVLRGRSAPPPALELDQGGNASYLASTHIKDGCEDTRTAVEGLISQF